jgi:hypothetical protein
MDRHVRIFAGGCLLAMMGIVMTAAGCRSMRNDVPPGKPYSTTGATPPPGVGFNSDPHPNTTMGLYGNGLTPNPVTSDNGPVGAPQYGTPTPNTGPLGTPTGNRYGAMPGTLTPPSLNQ